MTRKEITERKDAINYRVYKGGVRIGRWDEFTDEEKRELKELQCREMIVSCMVYYMMYDFYKDGMWGKYATSFVEELGEETVIRLIKEQERDIIIKNKHVLKKIY